MSDTVSETLRRAAAKLRAAAEAATDGPWHFSETEDALLGPLVHEVGVVSQAIYFLDGGWNDLKYVAMMSPPVGLLLAKWLEAESVEMDYGGTYTDCSQEIARLILGD